MKILFIHPMKLLLITGNQKKNAISHNWERLSEVMIKLYREPYLFPLDISMHFFFFKYIQEISS